MPHLLRHAARTLSRARPTCTCLRPALGDSRQAALPRPFSATAAPRSGSNAQLDFPCLDASEQRTQRYQTSLESGPEPSYSSSPEGVRVWHSTESLTCDYGGHLPSFDIAYESWGTLNADKSNVILLHTGLSASSHAHSTPENTQPGWWERYIGPGKPLDTDHFYILCTNVLGGCFGSTGPRSLDPADGQPYATRFPILTLNDMLRAQFKLLDHLGVPRLFASIGSSMGGMQSLAAATLFPNRVGAVVSISGCAKSHPYSIALRHSQRQIIMADANWSRGFYYDKVLPHAGMKLARQIATISYRSGPEWEHRFGSRRADESLAPAFCPDFLVETYLDHAGEKFIGSYDPNSLLYVSKAMDLFNLSGSYQQRLAQLQQAGGFAQQADLCRTVAYPEQPEPTTITGSAATATIRQSAVKDLAHGMQSMRDTPTLVVGVQSDNLMPVSCQREIADALRETGNMDVQYSELSLEQSHFGHDTFLLSEEVGQYVREFLTRRRLA